MTDDVRNFMAQEKQRKQPILTDTKNIFTYRFQPLQRLQPSFMTDGRRTSVHTKYNIDNLKVRIFSVIPQRQRIQPKFMTNSMRSFISNNQTHKHNPNNQTYNINVGFTSNKFCNIHIFKLRNKPIT